MRKTIETAPKNGVFVILEDAALGNFAVARWSVELAQWLDEDGTAIQLNATHWQLPQNLDEGGAPPPAQSMEVTADEPGSLNGLSKPSFQRVHREASHPASGDMPAQSQRAAAGGWIIRRQRSIVTMAACLLIGVAFAPLLYRADLESGLFHRTASDNDTGLKQALGQEEERANKLAGDVTAARREAESQAALIRQASEATDRQKEASERALVGLRQALQMELSKTEKLTGQLAEAQRDSATQATLIRKTIDNSAGERERVIGRLRQALRQQEEQTAQALRKIEDETVQARQASVRAAEALKQERDKVEELRVELATARSEGEVQVAAWQSASNEAMRIKEASARATDEFRAALRQAQDKAEGLADELAATRDESNKQSVMERSQALREAQAEVEKLAAELAASRREAETQLSVAGSAKARAAGVKEAAERGADEHQRALQQERDKIEKLTAQLAEARSSLDAQAKAKAADDAARDNYLVTVREELQKARAEATGARASLQVERTRVEQMEQRLALIEATTRNHGNRSLVQAVPAPSSAVPSVADAQTKAPTGDAVQPAALSMRSEASVEHGNPHTVRLITRANLLLDQGNIGAARNMLDRAAEMGSAEALFGLAETYDPLLLSARKTFGTQSDIAKARELYGKALAGGVSEAKLRLEALQQ